MFNPPPKTPRDYRGRAEACERLAGIARNEASRETMQYLALRWRTLASEAEAKAKSNERRPAAGPPSPPV
jgi:hypothetical protein